MRHRYGTVTLTFLEAAIEIDAIVERTVDDTNWVRCLSFKTSLPRTANPDDVTGVLWARLQNVGDFDASQTFVVDSVNDWVSETVYNA